MAIDDDDPTPPARPPMLRTPKGGVAIDHFPTAEFDCHDGTPYPVEWVSTRLAKLKRVLEFVRAAWATTGVYNPALIPVCGYRTKEYNARLKKRSDDAAKARGEEHGGVAEDSQHPEGIAVDVRPVAARDNPLLFALVDGLVRSGRLEDVGGLAPYPGWIHIDVRDKPANGHIARWVGAGYGTDR